MTAQPSDSPQSAPDETPQRPADEDQPSADETAETGAQPEPGAAVEATAAQAPADQPSTEQPPAGEPPAADEQPPAAEQSTEAGPQVSEPETAEAGPPADEAGADEAAAEATPDDGVAEVVETPSAYSDPGGDAVIAGDLATAEAPEPTTPVADADAAKAEGERAEGGPAEGGRKGKRKKKGKGGGDGQAQSGGGSSEGAADESKKADKKPEKKKPSGPDPAAIVKRIGTTSEAALAYVKDPDPKLARMARKHRETVITEIPPVTAGALLGPDALCRHFLASAATGRYRDLFFLWELFVAFPEECKPVLASRQRAQEKARIKLRTATHLGLLGDAGRVAADIDRATGLPWRWMREILEPMGPAIRQRPQVLAALKRRQPDFEIDLPTDPSDRWLAEAAQMRESGAEVPDEVDALLGAHADRLPATVATLSMASTQYPDRVPALIDRVDLQAPDIAAILAWARDHGHGEQLVERISETVKSAASTDRASGLAAWKAWQERGVDVPLPESVTEPNLDGLDLGRPESAELIKILVDRGAPLDPQKILDDVAAGNRQLGEKAYEAFVSAGFDDVHLPLALEGNPMVRPETRCPSCQAWTWVRPGLEKRCPREGCPLRARTTATPEDAGAAVDAAVASLGGEAPASQQPAGAPASDRPAQAPAPRPQPAPPSPAAPAPEASGQDDPAVDPAVIDQPGTEEGPSGG